MRNEKFSQVSFYLSIAAVVVAGFVSVSGNDVLRLAGTQWALIGIIFAVWSLLLRK